MCRATSEDLRWRVVWLYYWDEWEKSRVATCLRLSLDTVIRIIERFDSTGGVATWQGVRHAAPHNLKLTTAQELELMNRIIDNPHPVHALRASQRLGGQHGW
jgi:transposase